MIQARAVEPIFGHRLAALTDGEGCFYISTPRAKGNYMCGFTIKLREDDRPMLELYRDACGGIGRLVRQERKNAWAPTCAWVVTKKSEVGFLRDLFEIYPLWSKKQRDYEVWARAVDFWMYAVGYGTDWTPLAAAKAELALVREYREVAA